MEDREEKEYSLIDEYLENLYFDENYKICKGGENGNYNFKKIKEGNKKSIVIIFIIIIAGFVLFFFPTFISPYTNIIGTFFQKLINLIGNFLLTAGVFVFIIGVIALVFRKKGKWLLIGFLLILFGIILTGGSFDLFGFDFTLFEQSQGYH